MGTGSLATHYEINHFGPTAGDEETVNKMQFHLPAAFSGDVEKNLPLDSGGISSTEIAGYCSDVHESIEITYARPDIGVLIEETVNKMPVDKSVLVMGCGPEELMTIVRNTTAASIRPGGPLVELHCEQFGW